MKMSRKFEGIRVFRVLAAAAIWPMAAGAFSTGPPVNRTGALIDGGRNCTACHTTFAPANSGPGRVSLSAVAYTPGVKQNLTITVEDPQAQRWGFELTARLRSDQTKTAGAFTPVANSIRVVCDDGTTLGSPAPCNGLKEFATHLQPATQVGQTGKGTFTIEWTPPATDVGEIIFYFAGNAANNSSSPTGDHIYTSSMVIRPVCNLTVKPTITEIFDAASFRPAISSGQLISIKGTGYSSSSGVFVAYSSDLVAGKLDTKLACIAVEVGGKRAPVYSMVATQVNVQAPQLDATGQLNVQVIANPGAANELRSDVKTVTVQAVAPGLFTADGKTVSGRNASKELKILGLETAAAPGDIVTLYGTGFGPTNPAWGTGEFPNQISPLAGNCTVTMGGVTIQAADVLYAGASGDAPGFYQFNLRVPATLPDGDAAVKMTIGGVSTQDGTVVPVKK